jgi:hypothetical protein
LRYFLQRDLRPPLLVEGKRKLQHLVKPAKGGIEFSEHIDGDGGDFRRRVLRTAMKALSLNDST